jgi:putrescine aminotransferase
VCGIPELFAPYAPLAWPGFVKSPAPYALRDRGSDTDENLVRRCADLLADAVRKEDPETEAAIILEPCLSSGGIIIPPLGWLERVRDLCDELEVLMIADEVITGFGRTGRWFAVEHERVVPDLMTVAKGITSGYIPLSGAIARARIADVFGESGHEENVHPNTYCGHPVACAAALANIAILEREGLIENSARMGERLHAAIARGVGGLPLVGEVRSRGLLAAVDLVDPRAREHPLAPELVASLNMRAWRRGVIPFARGSVLRLAPPLCIDAAQVDALAAVVCECIEELHGERAQRPAGAAAARAG